MNLNPLKHALVTFNNNFSCSAGVNTTFIRQERKEGSIIQKRCQDFREGREYIEKRYTCMGDVGEH